MEFLSDYGLFLAKTLTVLVAVLVAALGITIMAARSRSAPKEHIEVNHLNKEYENRALTLRAAMLSRKEWRKAAKELQKRHKAEQKGSRGGGAPHRRRVFVLDFHGDLRASAVTALREEITTVLNVATEADEVLLRLESSGGLVHAYGLAASQLRRLREKQLPLTVAVDKVAASGGYMMACVGDKIIAAPFAVLGSIGVVSQLPNFHRLLKRNEVDFEMFTAGEYKRTVTLFGENSEPARRKFQQDIDDTHELFKAFVLEQRPAVDIDQVATGEHWFATRAHALKLVDELRTSDDFLMEASDAADLYEVKFTARKPLLARLLTAAGQAAASRHTPWAAGPVHSLDTLSAHRPGLHE